MQEHLARALTFLRGGLGFLLRAFKEFWLWTIQNKKFSIPLLLIIVAAIGALFFFLNAATPASETDTRREVELITVGDVSTGEPIVLIGDIRSVSEADVAADSSGRVTHVYRSIGDYVAGGTVIAEIENSGQRAAVAQAKAALEAAKSGATLSGISVESAAAAGESVRQSAYAAIASAVTGSADAAFSNASGNQPLFYISTSNSQLKNTVEAERLAISVMLARHVAARATSLSGDALVNELSRLSTEAKDVSEFLSNLAAALSAGIATGSVTESEIDAYEASVRGSLATVNALRSTLSGAAAAIKNAEEGVSTGVTGETAGVAAAQAGLQAAEAALQKTYVRAPISGTISSINLEEGNFAAAGSPAVRIVNTGGLEAVAYLSERDLPRVERGSLARIGGIADGRVTRVSPALDPVTRKAEIRIAIGERDANAQKFFAGQSATIEISPSRTEGDAAVFIPISAVKITPDGAVVFFAAEGETGAGSAALAALPVSLGALSGGKVEITSGLTAENRIVKDARGLKEGQEVILKGE